MNAQKKYNVLVADDDKGFREILADALDFFDFKVTEAEDGDSLYQKGASLIKGGGQYAILVDNQMPEHAGEVERQWCGFERVRDLCKDFPDENVADHILFLSRWGLDDLPDDLDTEGKKYGLLREDHWWNVYTPFPILKSHIERLCKE